MKPAVTRLAALLLLAASAAAGPARALPSQTGRVELPVYSPAAARHAYLAERSVNGRIGYVLPLPTTADGKRYTLTTTGGTTGLEDPDVFFYQSLDGALGESCNTFSAPDENGKTEQGDICPSADEVARWAIVVLKVGHNASFTFSY